LVVALSLACGDTNCMEAGTATIPSGGCARTWTGSSSGVTRMECFLKRLHSKPTRWPMGSSAVKEKALWRLGQSRWGPSPLRHPHRSQTQST